MAKVTPLLWKRKRNADGHFPIWLRVADRHRMFYHSPGELRPGRVADHEHQPRPGGTPYP